MIKRTTILQRIAIGIFKSFIKFFGAGPRPILSSVLNFNLFHFIDFYTVLYRKSCKKSFAQITEEGIRTNKIF